MHRLHFERTLLPRPLNVCMAMHMLDPSHEFDPLPFLAHASRTPPSPGTAPHRSSNSTRRLSARPPGSALSATGTVLPIVRTSMREASAP